MSDRAIDRPGPAQAQVRVTRFDREAREDRTWGLLGGGFLLLAVADCMYAAQVAGGASQPSSLTNLFYILSVILLAFAAWQQEPEHQQESDRQQERHLGSSCRPASRLLPLDCSCLIKCRGSPRSRSGSLEQALHAQAMKTKGESTLGIDSKGRRQHSPA